MKFVRLRSFISLITDIIHDVNGFQLEIFYSNFRLAGSEINNKTVSHFRVATHPRGDYFVFLSVAPYHERITANDRIKTIKWGTELNLLFHIELDVIRSMCDFLDQCIQQLKNVFQFLLTTQ